MVWAKSCQATNGPATEDRHATSQQLLVRNWPHLEGFKQKDIQLKLQQKQNYDPPMTITVEHKVTHSQTGVQLQPPDILTYTD